jgi:hypothetical protein
MAYEGETVRITATVDDYDSNPVLPADVTSAVINLYDGAGNYVFLGEVLTYDDVEAYWYYDWQTSRAGGWIAQCVFTGAEYEVFEYVTVKVKAPKIVPTGQPVPS